MILAFADLGHVGPRRSQLPIRQGLLGLTSKDAIEYASDIGCQFLVLRRVVEAFARRTCHLF